MQWAGAMTTHGRVGCRLLIKVGWVSLLDFIYVSSSCPYFSSAVNASIALTDVSFSDPYFVPEISVKGVTFNSITIGWSQPPEEMKDHVHYYMLIVQNNSTTKEAIHPEQSMNLFLFTDLQSATTYRFKVSLVHEVQRIFFCQHHSDLGHSCWCINELTFITWEERLNSMCCEAGVRIEELFYCSWHLTFNISLSSWIDTFVGFVIFRAQFVTVVTTKRCSFSRWS
jgi:hypothetical protein